MAKKEKPMQFLSKETDCIFCGKTFKLGEILFVYKTEDTRVKVDEIHKKFMESFSTNGQFTECRYMICKAEKWHEYARKEGWTEFKGAIVDQEFVADDAFFALQKERVANDMLEEDVGIENCEPLTRIGNSTNFLCPHCHCALPINFDQYKKVRVGIFGGRRSGKTAYMVTAATKMMIEMPGAIAATVVTESKPIYDKLLGEAKSENGINPTDEGRVFPLAIQITPSDKENNEPFFLILQDIPGEFTFQENIHHLADDKSFLNQEAFFAIIDINMFVRTERKAEYEDNNAKISQKGEEKEYLTNQNEDNRKKIEELEKEITDLIDKNTAYEDNNAKISQKREEIKYLDNQNKDNRKKIEELEKEITGLNDKNTAIKERICLEAFGTIYNEFPFAAYLRKLNSVQLIFTKTDQWIEAAEGELRSFLEHGIGRDHSKNHDMKNNKINQRVLKNADERMVQTLSHPEVNAPAAHPMEHLLELFNKHNLDIQNRAHCAVACPPGPTMEGDCLNVLDPILNVCVWQNLLPTTSPQGEKKRRNGWFFKRK